MSARGAGAPRRLVVGLDGSRHASHVIAHLSRWSGRGRATVVRVVEPARMPSLALVPASVRAAVAGLARADTAARVRTARREVDAAAARLRRAGWRARAIVRVGAPLPELLQTVRETRAGILAVGARGAGGAARLLLGSVADGAVRRSPVPVLVVK